MTTKSFLLTSGPNQIVFGYSLQSKKWEFKAGNKTYLVACKGAENAKKVANIIGGALKRKGEMDNLARANINKMIGEMA